MGEVKFHERLSEKEDEEFVVETILKHRPKHMNDLTKTSFLVHWKGYAETENSWEPWTYLLPTDALRTYLQQLHEQSSPPNGLKQAKNSTKEYDERSEEDGLPIIQRKKKNLTGRKLTVVGDSLQLKGKGGVYAVLPYEQLDDKNKAIFKIGMTLNYDSRMEQMHTYFPHGVYWVSLLSDSTVPAWKPAQIKQWKETHNNKKPTVDEMKSMFYKQIEKYVFSYLENNQGKRIHATTRVTNPDASKLGETEWFYTNEDSIHEAFESAHQTFPGGQLQHFYLSGLDPDTNQLVPSINELAKQRLKDAPNYTGKVIFRL